MSCFQLADLRESITFTEH